jgi:hypothetical protein
MKIPEKEFKWLKQKVKELQSEIRIKDKFIREHERDWAFKLFDDLETIFNGYFVLLTPPPAIVKGSYKNRGFSFQIEVRDIVVCFQKHEQKLF